MFRYDDVSRKSESDVSTQPVKRDLRKTASAASRLIRVLPPTVPTKSTSCSKLCLNCSVVV